MLLSYTGHINMLLILWDWNLPLVMPVSNYVTITIMHCCIPLKMLAFVI